MSARMNCARPNEKVRAAIDKAGLMYWQIAAHIGIADTTFTKWLRVDLSDEKRELVMNAIEELTREKANANS